MRTESLFYTNPPPVYHLLSKNTRLPSLVTLPSKRRLEQLKCARVAAVQSIKKRKSEVSLVIDSAQLRIDNDKFSATDTSDTEGESGTWFWNENANESDSDTEKGGEVENKVDESESDLDIDEVRTEIKRNKEGEDRLRGAYGDGSRSTSRRERKSTRELEKQASKTYDIRALWKQNIELGMASSANSQVGLRQLSESQPIGNVSSPSLSNIPRGGVFFKSNQQVLKSQRTVVYQPLKLVRRAANFVCNVTLNQVLGFLPTLWKRPRVSKRKQHLAKIALLIVEGNKPRKDIRQIKRDRAFQICTTERR